MKKRRKKRNQRRVNYNRLGMLAIASVVVVFLGGLMLNSHKLQKRLDYYNQKTESLQEEIESENDRTATINQLIEYMKTDSYAEEVARTRLGLVKENEIVFREEKEINN